MRTLCVGAAAALAAGLALGAAMKPDLGLDDHPAGPQIVDDGPRPQPTGPFGDGVPYADYKGKLPDYVLGTDWKRLTAPPPAAPSAGAGDAWAGPPPAIEGLTPAADDAAASAPPPAFGADQAYADMSRAETTPLAWTADLEDEAPPEAAGDTRAR